MQALYLDGVTGLPQDFLDALATNDLLDFFEDLVAREQSAFADGSPRYAAAYKSVNGT